MSQSGFQDTDFPLLHLIQPVRRYFITALQLLTPSDYLLQVKHELNSSCWLWHGHSHQYNIPNPSCCYSIPHNGNPNITEGFGNLGQCQQNGRCYFINFPWLGTKITPSMSWFCVSTSRRTIFLKNKEIGYFIPRLVTLDCNFTRHQWFQGLIFWQAKRKKK